MKVENNKDDVLSKGYPVSKMLIVLSTVFICQDSQRACIHFVCSEQMGSLSPCVCVCVSAPCCYVLLFMHMLRICGAHISMCLCVPKNACSDERPLHLHMFVCIDQFTQCTESSPALKKGVN